MIPLRRASGDARPATGGSPAVRTAVNGPVRETLKWKLVQSAQQALTKAYAPYSHFHVGAAVLGASGKIYSGCNVENASYGLTVCAERVAIFQAVTNGPAKITAVAIVTQDAQEKNPCGACLQVMAEFAGPDLRIYLAHPKGRWVKENRLADFLPQPFQFPR